jgi:hypothetical protein
MPRRVKARPAVVLTALLVVLVVAVALWVRTRPAPITGAGRPAPLAPVEETSGHAVEGLRTSGVGPLLSWTPVKGSYLYHVAVRGPDGAWLWQGTTTSVVFGTVEDQLDYLVPFEDAPAQVMTARQGAKYTWFVTAFSAEDGSVAAVSPMNQFVYQPPPGDQRLPPRSARRFEPSYDCARLVPETVRNGALSGFAMVEESPCGATPRPGCPWTCSFSRPRETEVPERFSIYFDCRNSTAERWAGYPKLENGTPMQGLGRAAEQTRDDDTRTFRFQASAAPCIVTVRSMLDERTSLDVSRTVDGRLTWESLSLRPPAGR